MIFSSALLTKWTTEFYIVALVIILAFSRVVWAQTEVAGEVSGVWDIEGSPYIATDMIVVPNDNELIIQPGVEVRFQGLVQFFVNGLLRAIGTEEDSIWFISDQPEEEIPWAGIQFCEADPDCEVAFSHISGVGWEGAPLGINTIFINRCSAVIRNCLITGCFDTYSDRYYSACVWALYAPDAIIIDNTIEGNTGSAVGSHGGGVAQISGNIIRWNTGIGIYTGQSLKAIIRNNRILENTLTGIFVENILSIVENNDISGNTSGGIISNASRAVIKGNIVTDNEAVRYGGGLLISHGQAIIARNVFAGNIAGRRAGGIHFQGPGKAHIYNTVVYGNSSPMSPGGINMRYDDNRINIQNCILWENQGADIPRDFSNIGFSIVQSRFGDEGMVNEEPDFIDPENYNFRVSENSPCIDAGNPLPLYNDEDGSRADLGVYGGNDLLFGFGEMMEFREIGYYCNTEDNFALCNLSEDPVALDRILLSDRDNFTLEVEAPLAIPSYEWFNFPITFSPMEAGDYNATISYFFNDYEPVEMAVIRLNCTALDGVVGQVTGVWTQEMSPIHIIGNADIVNWDTLRINPGVEMRFDPGTSLNGSIYAIGTPEDSIRFTSSQDEPEPGDWNRLYLRRSMVAYCVVEYANVGVTLFDGEITHSIIHHCLIGVRLLADGILRYSSIFNCSQAINSDGEITILNHNQFAFNEEIDIAFSMWNDVIEYAVCEGNIFYQNGIVNNFARPHPLFRNNCMFESEVAGRQLIGALDHVNANGTPCDENFNIVLDPHFVNPEEFDFHLSEDSPCIDAGNLERQRDPDGSWPDMGPIPFHRDDEEPPQVVIEPDLIEAEEPSDHVINLTNIGEGRLWWRVLLDEDWITGDPPNGVLRPDEDLDLIVALEDMDFQPGIYEADLTIDSNDPENPTFIIPVTLRIGGENIRALDVVLSEGWNLISLNIDPLNCYVEDEEQGPDILRMFEPVVEHLIMVKDELGRFYAPEFEFNNIPFWNLTKGYLVKTNAEIEASWSGEIIPADSDVPLSEGWNNAAYFPTFELDASAPDFRVLSPIIENVIIAKDESGRFLAPEFDFSNMLPWRESRGYQIRVDEDVALNYPEGGEEVVIAMNAEKKQSHYSESPSRLLHFVRNDGTGENMSVLITSINGINSKQGDQIGAFDLDGNLVGVGNVEEDGRCGLAVWGDDLTTEIKDGLGLGEGFRLIYWDSKTDCEILLEPDEFIYSNSLEFHVDELVVLNTSSKGLVPESIVLKQNYPNPFNSVTKITFGFPEAAEISLKVFDISGRVVRKLAAGEYKSGYHSMNWDADFTASGVYFINLQTEFERRSIKVVLVK